MAKKSEIEKLAESLMDAPWWMSLVVSVGAYILLFAIVPAIMASSPVLSGVAELSKGLAPIAFFFFWFIGLLAFVNGKRKARLVDELSGVESLRELSWKNFEELVAESYRRKGYSVIENSAAGADGGIDLRMKRDDDRVIVQCKNWKTRKVGVKVIRELYGVMTSQRANRGIVICSGTYTKEATAFARNNSGLELIGGTELLALVCDVQMGASAAVAIQDLPIANNVIKQNQSPVTPKPESCPRCGKEMILRTARKGHHAGKKFFGCSGYPDCRAIVPLD